MLIAPMYARFLVEDDVLVVGAPETRGGEGAALLFMGSSEGIDAPGLPLAVIMWDQWRHAEGGLFERGLVVFIEGLEHVVSNVSSTLSFLRVAAFSLNHIALAAAVFAIAAMLDTFGHWVTVVLGNIFIIVLEGAIVGIQCLRLEYYEGFSRFFTGKGKAFAPLKLGT